MCRGVADVSRAEGTCEHQSSIPVSNRMWESAYQKHPVLLR